MMAAAVESGLAAAGVERSARAPTPPAQRASSRGTSCLRAWRRWIRPVMYAAYGLLVAVAIPFIILDIVHADDRSFQIMLAGIGFFAMVISIPISLWGIINHIVYYTRPDLQKFIIRILWLVPIYALNSFFALRFPAADIYLDTLRQLYQAYVIYNYLFYLLTFFEEVPEFQRRLLAKDRIKSPPPCCCVKAVPNQRIVNRCRNGVLNYTVIRIIFSVVSIITDLTGTFMEGNYSPRFAYLWVTICVTVSQVWAIFCLALLRKATFEELQMLPRSRAQFVGIQVVVFFTNFQSAIVNLLVQFGALAPKPEWGYETPSAFATMLQDLLICFEMILGAAIFSYAFDYNRYNTDSERRVILSKSFKEMFNVTDVGNNIMEHLRFRGALDRHRGEAPGGTGNLSPPTPDSPTSIQDTQLISLPEIVVVGDHCSDDPSDSAASGRGAARPSNGAGQDGGRGQNGGLQNDGFEARGEPEQRQAANSGAEEEEEEGRDDVSVDSDVIGEEFAADDESDDNQPTVDAGPCTAGPDDGNLLGVPRSRHAVKRVSYTGGSFDDMDWDYIKSHRSLTLDSQTPSEGFGSSEA